MSNLSKFQNFTTNILQDSAGEASFFYIYVLVSLVQHVQKMGQLQVWVELKPLQYYVWTW